MIDRESETHDGGDQPHDDPAMEELHTLVRSLPERINADPEQSNKGLRDSY